MPAKRSGFRSTGLLRKDRFCPCPVSSPRIPRAALLDGAHSRRNVGRKPDLRHSGFPGPLQWPLWPRTCSMASPRSSTTCSKGTPPSGFRRRYSREADTWGDGRDVSHAVAIAVPAGVVWWPAARRSPKSGSNLRTVRRSACNPDHTFPPCRRDWFLLYLGLRQEVSRAENGPRLFRYTIIMQSP